MFDFRKVWQVANHLARENGEEYNRSAISRYYYSLFCCARLYLLLIMHEYEFGYGKNVHNRVCNRLKNSNDFTEHSLGKRLEKLRELRNFADYDWNIKDSEFFRKNLNFAKNESKRGLEQIDALKRSPPYDI